MTDNTFTSVIAGFNYTFPVKYTAGQPISQTEADALNLLLAENVGNNFRRKINDAKDEATKAGEVFDATSFQDAIFTAANEYEFAGKRSSRAAGKSALEAKAYEIARRQVVDKLKVQGLYSKITKEQIADFATKLATREDILAEAQKQLDSAAAFVIDDLFSGLGLENLVDQAPAFTPDH